MGDPRTLRQQRIEIRASVSSTSYGNNSSTTTTTGRDSNAMSSDQEQILQVFVLIACSVSFISLGFVILHYLWDRYARRCGSFLWRLVGRPRWRWQLFNPSTHAASAISASAGSRDFNSQLVFILSWIDLCSIVARMIGRTVLDDHTWCIVQAAAIHAGGLASCLWTTCMSFNLYRWIVFGESDKKRRARLAPFLLFTIAPSVLLTMYPLRAGKYGNATFYCFLLNPVLMFAHFYLYYVILAVANVALLLLIRMNLRQRVQWHDSASTDVTSAVIRRKALLYITIFLVHRIPIIVYRSLEACGVTVFLLGVAVQFVLNLDGFSNAVVYGGLFKKIPGSKHATNANNRSANGDSGHQLRSNSEDNDVGAGSMDSDEYFPKRFKNNGTLSVVPEELGDRMTDTSVSSNSNSSCPGGHSTHDLAHHSTMAVLESHGTPTHQRTIDLLPFALDVSPSHANTDPPLLSSKKRRFAAGILERASIELGSDRRSQQQQQPQSQGRRPSQSFSIFVSTFNMGEQNVSDGELAEWIPIGHEIYVIGVQECMNLGDLQGKILTHLIAHTKQKYIHFSREIGKRATALGYHGYIALSVFVLEEAILAGRFEMPQREALSKHAQEVYRGKSLLLFGRASNKGAVGLSFRYGNTSFAFVTCHLASDSGSSGMAGKKLSFRNKSTAGDGSTSSIDGTSVSSSDGTNANGHEPPTNAKTAPSKVGRRNQDAMEILQQLHLDEEDYGLGFPLLHHHSFVLGDLNYRMARKCATPTQMLDLLGHMGHFKSTPSTARTSSGAGSASTGSTTSTTGRKSRAFSAASTCRQQYDLYEEVTTPTMMRLVPDLPAAIHSLIRDHDELTALRESCQLFYGFEEPPITFFPTFRRIRGESLQTYDTESLIRNYSLQASGGGLRVPSYTDRILHTSLPGRQQQVQCLYYDSCEAVTTSDHKPVCAVFRVAGVVDGEDCVDDHDSLDAILPLASSSSAALLSSQRTMLARIPSFFGGSARAGVPPVLRRKNSGNAASDVVLKIEFRSIQWMDVLDDNMSGLFSRLKNVELGFLFPLPCEDVLSQQRKLQEVAENLNWGESIDMSSRCGGGSVTPKQPAHIGSSSPGVASSVVNAASSNFHVMPWNAFVEQGLRYSTRIAPRGKKHVALLIRTRSRAKQTTTRARSRAGSAVTAGSAGMVGAGVPAPPFHSTGGSSGGGGGSGGGPGAGLVRTASFNSARPFTSSGSGSYEFTLGHGTFCIEKMGKRQVAVVPLTVGGNLVGRLSLRVTLQERSSH